MPIDPKTLYFVKTLSRTNRKDFENYVINAIWHRLSNPDIEIVSQQYVKKNDGSHYFIDLYFPSLNLGIECLEQYHNHKEQISRDQDRAEKIFEILTAIKESSFELIEINIEGTFENLENQINGAIQKIRNKIKTINPPEWKIVTEEEYFKNRLSIHINDRIKFKTISKTCNVLFKTNYPDIQGRRQSYFSPKEFKHTILANHKLWFPKLAVQIVGFDGKNIEISTENKWKNLLKDDGNLIVETNEKGKDSIQDNKKRIVFLGWKDNLGTKGYKFIGVFQFHGRFNEENHFRRIQDELIFT